MLPWRVQDGLLRGQHMQAHMPSL